MLITALALLGTLPALLEAEKTYRVFLKPLDFHEGEITAYLASIHQIESDGKRLYFRGGSESQILITDLSGRALGVLGGEGGHPSEFGPTGVLALAVDAGTVSGIDKGLRFVRFYEDDRFHSYLNLDSYNSRAAHATSNIYAFSKDHVVVPALDPKHLAIAYQREGKKRQPVGEPLDMGGDLKNKIELNATLWCYQDGLWYAVHKLFPMVTVFDRKFQMVNQFQIRHKVTDAYISYLTDFQPNENFSKALPLVTDVKWFRDSLFLMVQGKLFQVDPKTGTVASITFFYGKGEDFGPADGHKVTLPFFTFSNDGVLFAAHPALLWNHDFWYARLPFMDE